MLPTFWKCTDEPFCRKHFIEAAFRPERTRFFDLDNPEIDLKLPPGFPAIPNPSGKSSNPMAFPAAGNSDRRV